MKNVKKSLKDFTPMSMEDQQKIQGGDISCTCGAGTVGYGKPTIQVFCGDNMGDCANACIAYCNRR